jgi:prepilin-type N-terminal cleavage/methylation domain-containing protein
LLRFFLNRRRHAAEGGFTLIELVVVLAILGILLTLAFPRYLSAKKRAYKTEIDQILQEAKTLSWAYYQENEIFPDDVTDISLVMPVGAAWSTPAVQAGGGSAAFITWSSIGAGGPLVATDICSVTISNTGGAAEGCSF